jgi:hypothetical protein
MSFYTNTVNINSGPMRQIASQSKNYERANLSPPNKWTCYSCTYNNLMTAQVCYICDTPKNIFDKIETILPPKLSDSFYEEEPRDCMSCSYLNGCIFKSCKKCRATPSAPPLPLSQSEPKKKKSWTCSGCTYINTKGNKCDACSCPKVSVPENEHVNQPTQDQSHRSYFKIYLDRLVFLGKVYLIRLCFDLVLALVKVFL